MSKRQEQLHRTFSKPNDNIIIFDRDQSSANSSLGLRSRQSRGGGGQRLYPRGGVGSPEHLYPRRSLLPRHLSQCHRPLLKSRPHRRCHREAGGRIRRPDMTESQPRRLDPRRRDGHHRRCQSAVNKGPPGTRWTRRVNNVPHVGYGWRGRTAAKLPSSSRHLRGFAVVVVVSIVSGIEGKS